MSKYTPGQMREELLAALANAERSFQAVQEYLAAGEVSDAERSARRGEVAANVAITSATQDAETVDDSLTWKDSPTMRRDSETIRLLADAIEYIHAQAACTEFDAVELLANIKARTTELGAGQ